MQCCVKVVVLLLLLYFMTINTSEIYINDLIKRNLEKMITKHLLIKDNYIDDLIIISNTNRYKEILEPFNSHNKKTKKKNRIYHRKINKQ